MQRENHFRNNYRKKSMDPSKRQYKSSTFLMPAVSPSKTDLLGSSTAFRNLSSLKTKRDSNSTQMRHSAVTNRAVPQFTTGKDAKTLRASTTMKSNPQIGMYIADTYTTPEKSNRKLVTDSNQASHVYLKQMIRTPIIPPQTQLEEYAAMGGTTGMSGSRPYLQTAVKSKFLLRNRNDTNDLFKGLQVEHLGKTSSESGTAQSFHFN